MVRTKLNIQTQRIPFGSAAELKAQSALLDRAEFRRVYVGDAPFKEMTDPEILDSEKPEAYFKAVVNLDKGHVSQVCSDEYMLIQHAEVVDAVSDALMRLNVPVSGKITNRADRVIIDIDFTGIKHLVSEGEEFMAGMRVINSINGSSGLMLLPRMQRLACSNGMIVNVGALGLKSFTVRHRGTLQDEIEGIAEVMLNSMINCCDKLKALVSSCMEDSVEWDLAETILQHLVKAKKHREAVRERLEGNRDLTRWDIYNALTNYLTHGEQLSPHLEMHLQNKAQKLLTTGSDYWAALEPVEV